MPASICLRQERRHSGDKPRSEATAASVWPLESGAPTSGSAHGFFPELRRVGGAFGNVGSDWFHHRSNLYHFVST